MFFSLKPINISPWNYVWSEKILKAFLSDFSDSVDGLWHFAGLILYHFKILESSKRAEHGLNPFYLSTLFYLRSYLR